MHVYMGELVGSVWKISRIGSGIEGSKGSSHGTIERLVSEVLKCS